MQEFENAKALQVNCISNIQNQCYNPFSQKLVVYFFLFRPLLCVQTFTRSVSTALIILTPGKPWVGCNALIDSRPFHLLIFLRTCRVRSNGRR